MNEPGSHTTSESRTAAPWEVFQEVPGSPCRILGRTANGPGSIGSALKLVDARMMASAPELAEALHAALAFIGQTPAYKIGHTGAHRISEQGIAALRKAGLL